MKIYYHKTVLTIVLVASSMANGLSRHNDGELFFKKDKGNICLSGKEYKSSGLFINKSINIDDGDIEIDEITVASEKNKKVIWKIISNNDKKLRLTSSKCIVYGEKLDGYKELINLELETGLNKAMIIAYDTRNNNRAYLYGKFCMEKIKGDSIELVDCK